MLSVCLDDDDDESKINYLTFIYINNWLNQSEQCSTMCSDLLHIADRRLITIFYKNENE